MLSQAVEDYIKTIYRIRERGDTASTSDIARALNVSAASVTNMAKRLAQMGLTEYEPYQGVRLTDTGNKVALEIIRHHRLLELYLRNVMGYPWDKVHEEAELLEHHISEEFEQKIDEMLGHPTHDPHGDPIPTREGEIAEHNTNPLAAVAAGLHVAIERVSDEDPALLNHLESLGLLPGATLEVVGKEPFEGPLKIRVGEREHMLGYRIANHIFVEVLAENA